MQQLIKISERNGSSVVSARDLHVFLESKQDFSNWIKNRIDKYGFIDGVDFQSFNNIIEREVGASKRIEFALSIDCAKEISMVEGNDKGKQARRYFIECEKAAKNPLQNISRIDLAKMIIESEEENQRLQIELKENEPLVVFAKALQISEHNILIGELAKILKQNDIEIGQNRLFVWLRENSYLIRSGEQYNLPTQKSLELGLFEVKTTTINNPDGSVRVTKTTKVTPKGQKYFINKFLKHNLKIV